mgnify:FL=1
MSQKVLNISLPKERSLDQLKNFKFLKKIVSEIELFFSNKENFLLVSIKEDLVRNYLFQAALNSFNTKPIIVDLKKDPYNLENFNYPIVFVKNLSNEYLSNESESFLFNAFNYCLNKNSKILFLSNDFVKSLNIKLPDLESRLSTILPIDILNPTDEEKMDLINFELQQRGLIIKEKEMKYIFTHHARDLTSLLNLAEKLDEISFKEKKSISINLIKKII